MDSQERSRRLRERIKLSLPARVHCRETAEREWVEMTRLTDVTPFGAGFPLTRPTEPGRLLQITLPMPRQLRCFDHIEDQYRVWAVVRRVAAMQLPGQEMKGATGGQMRFAIGVAFTGKYPPASYLQDPSTRYEVGALSPESNMWNLREREESSAAGERGRSDDTRLQVPLNFVVEVFDEQGTIEAREQTVTENISRRGAAVWTTLQVERGRFVRLTNIESGLSAIAAVRASRKGPDGIPRLHLEFVDRQWPLEGIE